MNIYKQKELAQFLSVVLRARDDAKDLLSIIIQISKIGKELSLLINKAGLLDIFGNTGKKNIHNEVIQKLDAMANTICINLLKECSLFASLASEEEDGIIDIGSLEKEVRYVIAIDPLDGSGNIDINASVGTIFSVHKLLSDIELLSEKHFLQKGKDLVLAGYILYGSSTVLVISWGEGVYEFTFDPCLQRFFLSRERIRIPQICTIYSVNESNCRFMNEKDRLFIRGLRCKYTSRYIGALVADFHRNLIKGGIFLYPGIDKHLSRNYQGKLRLLYEAQPIAFLLENAWGLAVDGISNILDIEPKSLHQRTPLIMGNAIIIKQYLAFKTVL